MHPLIVLLALLVVVPAAEIALFIHVGGALGVLPTVLLTFVTAALGILLVRMQGVSTLARLQATMFSGADPFREMLAGALLLLAGILLLIPGFLTDALGFALLLPPVRRAVARLLAPATTASRATVIEARVIEVRERTEEDDGRRLP